jgi:hypothetical protein
MEGAFGLTATRSGARWVSLQSSHHAPRDEKIITRSVMTTWFSFESQVAPRCGAWCLAADMLSATEVQSMSSRLLYLVVLGSLLQQAPVSAQDLPRDVKAALAPLDRLKGTWEKRFTFYKSEWTPKEEERTGTHSCQWILNDRYLQESGRDSDGATYLTIYSYDSSAKAYRVSAFRSDGNTWQMTGKWDAETSTFTWSHKLSDSISMEGKYQFLNPNEFKFSYITKGDGKLYFHLEGTGKRVEANKK